MREQLESRKQIKPTSMREQADERKHINLTQMDSERETRLEIEDLMAKFKLDQEEKMEKGRKEGRWVRNNIKIPGNCITCGKRISWEGRCDECRKCTSCGGLISREGKCEVCAEKLCGKWLDELPLEHDSLEV